MFYLSTQTTQTIKNTLRGKRSEEINYYSPRKNDKGSDEISRKEEPNLRRVYQSSARRLGKNKMKNKLTFRRKQKIGRTTYVVDVPVNEKHNEAMGCIIRTGGQRDFA